MPRSSTTQILGFTQLPHIAKVTAENLKIDVWYQVDGEVGRWKKAFRIIWDQWPKIVSTYSKGDFVSSSNSKFQRGFCESYDASILNES